MYITKKIIKNILFVSINVLALNSLMIGFCFPSYIDKLKEASIPVQLGMHFATQGQSQNVGINGAKGDYFTVTKKDDDNGLVGVGFYLDTFPETWYNMQLGLDFFYLAKTWVKGTVIQEYEYTNLGYSYAITNYPIYFAAKKIFDSRSTIYNLTLDLGIGLNVIQASNFGETSLDGITIPDNVFKSNTTTDFSATAGIGIRLNQVFGKLPLECGYRFFYLGQGNLVKANDQVLNNLNTGDSYSNAVVCAITIS